MILLLKQIIFYHYILLFVKATISTKHET